MLKKYFVILLTSEKLVVNQKIGTITDLWNAIYDIYANKKTNKKQI